MQSSSFVIRPIHPDDYASEATLIETAYAAGVYDAAHRTDLAWNRVARDSAGRNRDGRVLVAVRDGRLIGSVTIVRGGTEHAHLATPNEAELRMLAVDPASHRQGIADALVRAACEEALGWGSERLVLNTGARNPARHLYERLHFEPTSEFDAQLLALGYDEARAYEYPLQTRGDVRVRLIHRDEIAEVSELVLAAYRDDYPQLDGPYLGEIADVASRAAEHQVWIAEDRASGALLGTITTPRAGAVLSEVARPGEMDIRLLGVAQRARGRGIGEHLTRHALTLARIRGVDQLVLNTSREMVGAWQLYEKLGFERLEEREFEITREDGTGVWLLAYGRRP